MVGFIYGFIVDVIDQLLNCGHSPDFGQAAKTGLYTGAAGGAGGVMRALGVARPHDTGRIRTSTGVWGESVGVSSAYDRVTELQK